MEFIEEYIVENPNINKETTHDLLASPELSPYSLVSRIYFNDGTNKTNFQPIEQLFNHLSEADKVMMGECKEVVDVVGDRLGALKSE